MSAPVASLFSKIGIDITKTLETPRYWDERIPLITDDGFNDTIVNEMLTEEEEEARTLGYHNVCTHCCLLKQCIWSHLSLHYSTVTSGESQKRQHLEAYGQNV